ncbi:hypothetical protein GCM10027168_23830 [Streptomyces capparidis]
MRTTTRITAAAITLVAAAGLAAPSAVAAPADRPAEAPASAAWTKAKPGPRWETSLAGTLGESHLRAVSSAGPDAAWAVGNRYDRPAERSRGVMLRWDGTAWRQETAEELPDTRYWESVSAVSRRDVWAYGAGPAQGEEVLARYDGRHWRQVALPEEHDRYYLSEVEAVPGGRAWMAGSRTISAYHGGQWRTTDLGAGSNIRDLDARAANDAWAVGSEAVDTHPSRAQALALHWDGRQWRKTPSPGPGIHLNSVYAESARSVWATAFTSGDSDPGFEPRVLHWNGTAWRDVTGPVRGIALRAVTGDGHGTVWLAGDPEGHQGPPVYWRWDGGRWTRTEGATVTGGYAYAVHGLAPAGRPGRFWAIGDYSRNEGQYAVGYEMIQRSARR